MQENNKFIHLAPVDDMKIYSFVGEKEDLKSASTEVKDDLTDSSLLVAKRMLPKSMRPPPLHPHRRTLNPTRRIEPPLRNGNRKRRSLRHWVFSGEVGEGVDPLRSGGLRDLPHLASVNLIDVGFIIP